LSSNRWDSNQAINQYYDKNLEATLPISAFKSKCNTKEAEKLFNSYANKHSEMDEDGIEKFYKDLGVNSNEDIVTNLVSMHMGAEAMGTYTKTEFVKGCNVLGVDTLQSWKTKMP
jgi:hypothetical protein